MSPPSTVLGHEVTVKAAGVTDDAPLQFWIRQDPDEGTCPATPSDPLGPRRYYLSSGDTDWTDVGPGPFSET